MKKKLAAVTLIRNECDIVELFIKINSRVFDRIFILDHMSNDGTTKIIKKMKATGYPVSHNYWTDHTFNQAVAITTVTREVAEQNVYDYIVPLDADEFLTSGNTHIPIEAITNVISGDQFGLVPWKTYCPISTNYHKLNAPLFENFRMRKIEPTQFYKVVLGNEFAKNCSVYEGSHFAENGMYPAMPAILPLIIQHAPVRSDEQIVRKAILGSYALALKKNRIQGEGYHWDLLAAKIREGNFKLSEQDIFEFALHYAASNSDHIKNSVTEDAPRIGELTDTIEHKELAHVSILQSFDFFIENLVKRVIFAEG